MSLLSCPLLACACAALLSLVCGNVLAPVPIDWSKGQGAERVQNCTTLELGKRGNRVVSYEDDMYIFTDKELLLPKVNDFGDLTGAKIMACNPTGPAPFVLANDGKNISGQVHCSFMEKPKRCPKSLRIYIEEYYEVILQ